MAFPLALGLGLVQGLTSLGGLLGGEAAKRRAEAARLAAINDLAASTDTDYNNLVRNDRGNLFAATGIGGDAISSLGRGLGSALAGAGVYNSSATAGALQQATGATQANLAGLAGQNFQNEQGLLNQNRRYVAGLRSNLANSQYGEASQNLNASRGGLSSFLGSLGQFNLGRSGANLGQASLGRAAGGYGGLGALSPGAGTNWNFLGGSTPGIGSNFNPMAFGTPGIAGPLAGVHQSVLQRQQFGLGGFNPNGY